MENILLEKSFLFALRIVKRSQYLNEEKKNTFCRERRWIQEQNIGLLIEEGKQGESRSDFLQKYSVANKEAFKTNFLLRLLREGDLITNVQAQSLLEDCEGLQKMLIATLKTVRKTE